jgi:putative nucleotidyltransferase with HDIG domain
MPSGFAAAKVFVRNRFADERRTPPHDWTHAQRVMEWARRIAIAENADGEIVRWAALLHDIARESKNEFTGDHARRGVRIAREILRRFAPRASENAILHAIAAHSRRSNILPQTLEARVIWDADKLDGLGAIGAERYLIQGSELGWDIYRSARYYIKTINNHMAGRGFYTATAKKIAAGRVSEGLAVCKAILRDEI